MTLGDAYALWGAGIEILSLPEGDHRDRLLLAQRRGRLLNSIYRCDLCPRVQRQRAVVAPEWAMRATSAILTTPNARIGWLSRAGLDLERTSWVPTMCPDHTTEALDCVGVDYLLLYGPEWVKAWRPDLDKKAQGLLGVWGGRWWVMPVWEKNESIVAVGRWAAIVNGFAGYDRPSEHIGTACVRCGGAVNQYDSDGVPWCVLHYRENRN